MRNAFFVMMGLALLAASAVAEKPAEELKVISARFGLVEDLYAREDGMPAGAWHIIVRAGKQVLGDFHFLVE